MQLNFRWSCQTERRFTENPRGHANHSVACAKWAGGGGGGERKNI